MAVGSFEELCAGFCDLAQVAPPELGIDVRGLVAFHVVFRGATVNVVYRPQTSPDHVFVVFEWGPVGQDGPNSFAELQTLLEANFELLEVHPPMFSRNPATGDAVLQYVYPLFDATPHGLHELVERGVDWVVHWRERYSAGPTHDMRQAPAGTDTTALPNFA